MHFLDAWEHSTGESLWDRGQFRNWKFSVAHAILPDGQTVFDFGDIWQGPLTRAKQGEDYAREYPTGALKSNFNLLYRVAARLQDRQAQAVAARLAAFGHTNQEEWWTLLWRDPALAAAPMSEIPLSHHFEDSGVFFHRTSWNADATAFALKAGPPEGHRTTTVAGGSPGVAAQQRPRPSRRRQLHHLGRRAVSHRRHGLRGPAAGPASQHDHGGRRRAGRRGRARRVAGHEPGRARHHPDHARDG